ncbi:MAG: cysteine methyltransferase [Planctomycetota bacterium]|nr:MAG: cysteine methyltransferase [Planctomycetota bacterium]
MGSYALFDSPIGTLLVATTSNGVCALQFLKDEEKQLAALKRRLQQPFELDASLVREFSRYVRWFVEGQRVVGSWSLDLRGVGAFRQMVYEKLRSVGWGKVTTYGDLARAVGSPKAARAVGQALAHNPIILLVPCHRVVSADGSLGGFTAGVDMKRRLLEAEGVEVVRYRVPLRRYRVRL